MRAALVLLALAFAGPALAQSMQGHSMPMPAASPSTSEFEAAMARMHKDMAIPYTGNADRDFVAGMIPHHQGAVDMARVELKYGTDPELRKMAQDIIDSQTKEIAFMKAWQARHP